VIGSSLAIPSTAIDEVKEDVEDDEDGDDCATMRARICCRSKPTGEQ
jgi:hypothetical protein